MIHMVVNHGSGAGTALSRATALQSALHHHHLNALITSTRSAGEASRFVQSLGEDVTVVSVGGDGTHRAVAASCVGNRRRLALLPAGTGNDYVAGLGIAKASVHDVAQAIARKSVRRVDVGVAWLDDDPDPHMFLNAFGMGFDADVAAHLPRLQPLPAVFSYAWATLRRLPSLRPTDVNVTVGKESTYRVRSILVAALIGQQTGGGFAFAPHATFDQGCLHTVIGGDLRPRQIGQAALQLVQRRPLAVEGVTTLDASELTIAWGEPVYAHLDGDSVGKVSRTRAAVREKALTLVTPSP